MSRDSPSAERFVAARADMHDAMEGGVDELSAERLLQLPVRSRGIKLGRCVDLVVDLEGRRVLALELHCGDELTRLLPLAAAKVGSADIVVSSALVLVDERGAAFYRERGTSFCALRERGELADVVIRGDGAIVALVTDAGRVPAAA
jgi:hypothetical protein